MFYILMGVFDWMGLQTNLQKTVSMECQTCNIFGKHSYATYKHSMAGEVPYYWILQRQRIW